MKLVRRVAAETRGAESQGAGPLATLVLLPSLGTTTRLWSRVVDALETRDRLDVLLFDLPGHGEGEPARSVSVGECADAVLSLVTPHRRVQPLVVAGVSMGGAIAIEAGVRSSEVTAVAAFQSALRFGSPQSWGRIVAAATDAGSPAYDREGTAAAWFTESFRAGEGSALVEELLDELADVDLPSYLACCRALETYDGATAAVAGLRGIAVGGASDIATDPERMREFAAMAPSIRYRELPGAHLAAFEDPRFDPVTLEELDDLRLEVSVLGPREEVTSVEELDADRYGVVVSDDEGRRGVLLPGLETVPTVEDQLRISRLKAGIPADAEIRIERFEVIKIKETENRP